MNPLDLGSFLSVASKLTFFAEPSGKDLRLAIQLFILSCCVNNPIASYRLVVKL